MKRSLASLLIFLLAWLWADAAFAEALAAGLSAYAFLTFVMCIGERIAILECISFIAALELLAVPAVTYWVFPASMPVEPAVYFSYALPAYLAFYFGLNWFRNHPSAYTHATHVEAVGEYLQDKKSVAVALLVIGLLGFAVKIALPTASSAVGTLPSYCLFISAFYACYSRSRFRLLIVTTVVAVLLTYTVREGMFGELFFWLILMLVYIAVSMPRPPGIQLKTSLVVVGFAFLLLIQSVKGEYRRHTWGYQRNERSGDAGLMVELIADRLAHPEKLLSISHLYISFVRFNQGIMIGSAMAKVPTHESYASGEVLMSFVYPFVPRLIWPNKPQTGGYENIRRFTSLPQSENTSINLSPVGEGYVNFGYGGILFALFYGLLLSGIFQYVFHLAEKMPTVILWLPVLYIGCLTMETDILSTWGSLVNSAIFITLLFWFLKRIGVQL